MLNAEVPYVRYLIGWIAKKFDYINRVTKRFHFRSTRVVLVGFPLWVRAKEGWLASPPSFIYVGRGHPRTHKLIVSSRVRCPPPP